MAYFQCFSLLKTVCLKTETVVPGVNNHIGSAVVIVAFGNLSLVVVNLEALLVLCYNSTTDQSELDLLTHLSFKVSDLPPSEASITMKISKL